MRIKDIFSYAYFVNVALFTIFGCIILFQQGKEYLDSRAALHDIEDFSYALKTMEKMSLERGPTNALMGEDIPHGNDRVLNLQTTRSTGDTTLAGFIEHLQSDRFQDHRQSIADYQSAQDKLIAARQQADSLIDLP